MDRQTEFLLRQLEDRVNELEERVLRIPKDGYSSPPSDSEQEDIPSAIMNLMQIGKEDRRYGFVVRMDHVDDFNDPDPSYLCDPEEMDGAADNPITFDCLSSGTTAVFRTRVGAARAIALLLEDSRFDGTSLMIVPIWRQSFMPTSYSEVYNDQRRNTPKKPILRGDEEDEEETPVENKKVHYTVSTGGTGWTNKYQMLLYDFNKGTGKFISNGGTKFKTKTEAEASIQSCKRKMGSKWPHNYKIERREV